MNDRNLLLEDGVNRERALALESFIVEAPAGAGKTELLTQRYLKLLSVVRDPEEIVAITFTNKAAAEMRSRVLQSLQDAEAGTPVDKPHKRATRTLALAALARAAALEWDLLAQPGRLRITTIDALSSLLARQMPLLSRFGAQPAIADDPSPHYREAATRTLALLEEEGGAGPVTDALRYLDNDTERLADLIAQMLARREQWLAHAGRESVQAEVEAALATLIRRDMAQAAEMLAPALQARLMPVARFAAANLPCDHPVALLLDWDAPLQALPEALPVWRSVCELLLTGADFRKAVDKRHGFPATDEGRLYKQALFELIAALGDPGPLAALKRLPRLKPGDDEWRIVANLAQLLRLAAAQLWSVFQEAGEVDFGEVAQRALGALEDESGPTELALRLDYRIQHLLVDEFQDTSPTQVQLLEKLTSGWEPGDGRTLFCVGDPMQSIYRFRKADVGLFLQAARYGIGDLALAPLHLTRNNRSCPAVIDWINRAFAGVFPPADDIVGGAIRYRPFAATRAAQPGEGVMVHPLVLAADTRAEAAAYEAGYLADLIERERAAYPGRRIAVLVRARAHLDALVAEIRRNRPHLRFQAVEIEQLGGRQAVQDVLALTRALLHRADRVHWLAVLRAPWCGLVLADLHALAADDHHATLWQLIHDEARLARLTPDGRMRLLQLRAVFAEAFAHRGREPLRRWIESVWLKLAGPLCLWDPGDVRDVQAYFDLVEKLEASGRFDFTRLATAMEKLYAAPDLQADDTLQFMTIHKSKGLEFDTVILPGLHCAPAGADAPLVLWEEVALDEAGTQLVAAPWVPRHKRDGEPSAYDYLQGLECARSANEIARVLYVGATRAERRLHLVGVLRPDAKGELKPRANTLLALLWDSVGAAFLAAEPATLSEKRGADARDFVPGLVRTVQPGVPPLLAGAARTAEPVSPTAEPAAVAPGNFDTDCGTLAHRYLEIIAQSGTAAWPAARIEALLPAMESWLAREGHAADAAERGALRVAAALATTLASAAGRWVLEPRVGAASEFALTLAGAVRSTTHVVDRTFVEHGERWVIDYKSAQLAQGLAPAQLAQEAERYRPQLERYAALFADEGLPLRLGVLFLASGTLVEL